MAGGLLAGGLSLTRDQLILLTLVAAVFALLLTANLGLCWLYRRLLTEDQRHLRRAQKKKMSDVWVYQVHRPAPSAVQPLPADPPSQQILRKLRNSYDNLRTAVEAGEEPGVTLGREESQVIEELEATADLFLHDTPSRRSSLSVYDNDVNTAPFPDHIDINAFTAGGGDTDNTSDQARGMSNHHQHKHSSLTDYDNDVNAASLLDRTDMNAFITGGGGDTDNTSDQARGVTNLQHRHSALTGYDNCRSPVSVHSGGGLSSFSSIPVDDDSVFNHDLDVSVPNNVYQTHLSVLQHREDSAAPVEVFASNHTEARPTNDVCALADVDNSLRDKVSFSSVTMEDFETNPLGPGVGVRGGGKRRKKGKRRGSTYDNVALQSFPVAEFHNEAFDFAAAAAGPASLEGAHSRTDLEL